MESKTLTCICCPIGCQITIELDENCIQTLTGNTCKRGETYARKEISSPERVVTTTVLVNDGDIPTIPVKTKDPVPKDKIFDCIKSLQNITVTAPVCIGDIVLCNVAGTGVDVIATKNVSRGSSPVISGNSQ